LHNQDREHLPDGSSVFEADASLSDLPGGSLAPNSISVPLSTPKHNVRCVKYDKKNLTLPPVFHQSPFLYLHDADCSLAFYI
jgi:hypothetical protein